MTPRLFYACLFLTCALAAVPPSTQAAPVTPIAASESSSLPPQFADLLPTSLPGGLRAGPVRSRVATNQWRDLDIRALDGGVAGYTVMLAYRGESFFANVKAEISAPDQYEADCQKVQHALTADFDALLHRGLTPRNSAEQAQVDAAQAAGLALAETGSGEAGKVRYVYGLTNTVVGAGQVIFFVPDQLAIISVYLLGRKPAPGATLTQVRATQRQFVQHYVDFLNAR